MRWLIGLLILVLFAGALPTVSTATTVTTNNQGATAVATQDPLPANTSSPSILPLTGITAPIHDPTLIKEGDRYYVFSTGPGISIHCSKDMLYWTNCGKALTLYPQWVYQAIPGVTDLWAPDIVFLDGTFHLYYSASTFGSNRSAIGLATNVTLDQGSPNYKWVDQGEVVSTQRSDNHNAIDANLVADQIGERWLVYGSHWTGIKMRKVDSLTGKPSTADSTLYSLASRPGITAIEGAFITYRNDYYYLFVSFDACCRGVDSTYKIMIGRSEQITGPYMDRDGKALMEGGGSLVYAGSKRWRGPGHNSIYKEKDTYWMVYHSYDAELNGAPTLRIEALQWDKDGWPISPSALVKD
jgi:arabinan endo-1,5-alpha-L-arabinosidase